MDLSAVMGAYEGLKAIYGGVKGLADIKEEFAVKAKAAELLDLVTSAQGKIFEIQASYTTALSRIDELEAEIVKTKNWAHEKARYKLHELMPGTLVYRIKPECQGLDPGHDICPNCYEQGIKSILQASGTYEGFRRVECPFCKAKYLSERIEAYGVSIDPNRKSSRHGF